MKEINCSCPSLCRIALALMVFYFAFACPAKAQFDDDEAPAADSPQVQKVFATIELAKMAAEADQPEVSFEAIRRIATIGPVINKVDLGGLLSSPQQNSSMNMSRNTSMNPQQQSAGKVSAKMIQVSDLWVKKNFDPQRAYDVWFEQVFPKDSANTINLHAQSNLNPNQVTYNSFSLSTNVPAATPKTGAQCLIDWAVKADKVALVEQELTKRAAQPGNADLVWLFQIWFADAKQSAAEVYETILTELEPKLGAQIVGIHSDVKTNAVRGAMKKLPSNSELKSRLKKSFLKALPTSSNWNSNPSNTQFLCELILESIEANEVDAADSVAEAVLSQWSSLRANNAEYVRSMESQAFQELSHAAFDKKAFKLGSIWMQRSSIGGNNQQGDLFPLRSETTQQWLKCPPDIRYDVLSKNIWTTPMLGLSQWGSMMPQFLTSTLFRSNSQSPIQQLASPSALSVSVAEWMMRDAIALGRRTEIEKKIQELGDSKSDDLLLAKLVWSKANDQPIDLKSLIEAAKDGEGKEISRLRRLVPADGAPLALEVEIAERAVRDNNFRELGVDLANRLLAACLKHNNTALMSQCRSLLHLAKKEANKSSITHEQLKHFVEASDWDGGAVLDGIPSKAIWLPRNESKSSWGHETSLMQSYLFLKYPLMGDFEIAFKARDGSYSEPGVTLGGILTEFCPYNKTVALSSIGYRHSGSVNKKFEAYKQGDWNEYHIKRNAKEFQVSINGQHAVTIPSEGTSTTPFFALGAQSYRSSTFDELRITGKVTIPRQVELCTPRLAGWSAYYTNQWLEPIQLMESVQAESSGDSDDPFGASESDNSQQGYEFENEEMQKFPYWYGQQNGDADYAWKFSNDSLESVDQKLAREFRIEEMENSGANIPDETRKLLEQPPKEPRTISLIYYQRPLCDGESIELEFYQDTKPEQVEGKSRSLPLSISPIIGRVAMLIDQPDIALRWIAGQGEKEWLGTEPDQRVVDPAARQTAKPQIKERDWNTMTILYIKNSVVLSINGQKLYERKWETNVAPQFGLYHQPDSTQVRVRNVRLSGNWPEKLPENLFELTQ